MRHWNRRDWMKLGAAGLAASTLPCAASAGEAPEEGGLLQPVASPPSFLTGRSSAARRSADRGESAAVGSPLPDHRLPGGVELRKRR